MEGTSRGRLNRLQKSAKPRINLKAFRNCVQRSGTLSALRPGMGATTVTARYNANTSKSKLAGRSPVVAAMRESREFARVRSSGGLPANV